MALHAISFTLVGNCRVHGGYVATVAMGVTWTVTPSPYLNVVSLSPSSPSSPGNCGVQDK
jgi:hypothetical protein